jgi:protein involved in polysaccharide export with SLBB domain
MYLRKISLYWPILLLAATLCFSTKGTTQNLSGIDVNCDDLTPTNLAMAEASGYSIDALCGGAGDLLLPAIVDESPIIDVQQRQTVSSLSSLRPNSLPPFGYDLFAGIPNTFASSVNIPVSSDYLLGPGDELSIYLYGKLNRSFLVTINRDGVADFPEIGPVVLAGLSFGQAKEMLHSMITSQIIGTEINISMGSLRSIQVFVLGEAFKPGAYMVSSLATITHALMSTGGVSNIASLRNIQLKRNGNVIANLDLYDLLLSGDTTGDVRLQPADIIFIPTVGDKVSIGGEVLRPATYELKDEATIMELLELAGGITPAAYKKSAKIERVNPDGFMTEIDLDLGADSGRQFGIVSGDYLRVGAVSEFKKDIVSLEGYVNHGGNFAWYKGMRVSDVIESTDQFPLDVDLDFGLVIRQKSNGVGLDALKLDLRSIFNDTASAANYLLQSRDRLLIFGALEDRSDILQPLLRQFRLQARFEGIANIVSARGEVKFPGEYLLVDGMSIGDLIGFAGGLAEGAYEHSAELVGYDFGSSDRAVWLSKSVDLGSEAGLGFGLKPRDSVFFKTLPEFRLRRLVTLSGEFNFPGEYEISPGETLSSVINRAGGVTSHAFLEGAVFTRESLRQRERENLELVQRQNTAEVALLNAGVVTDQSGPVASVTNSVGEVFQPALEGRLVLSVADVLIGNVEDLVLENGDSLMMPVARQEVTIVGDVYRPSSHIFSEDAQLQDYLELSGGHLPSADVKRIYLVRASGQVLLPKKSLFVFNSNQLNIKPGDTIVVPRDMDVNRMKGIPFFAEVSKIVYQLSLGAAAINSFKN